MSSTVILCEVSLAGVFLLCAVVVRRAAAPAVLTTLTAATGGLLVLATVLHPRLPDLSSTAAVAALSLTFPVLVLLYPDGRPAPTVGLTVTAVVASTGLLAVLDAGDAATVGVYGLVQFCLVAACVWWRVEGASPDERLSLHWAVLLGVSGLLVAGHLAFLSEGPVGAVLTTVALSALPVGLAVGLVRPEVVDVRTASTRTVGEAGALVAAVAVFVGVVASIEGLRGSRLTVGESAVVAAFVAAGYHGVRQLLLGVADQLLFGPREDTVRAASHVGRTLADPVLALRALREALGLPYAALTDGAEPVAVSGTCSTVVVPLPLLLGTQQLGRLDVGLRPGELRLTRQDRTTLDVVTPALVQMLHALTLTRALQDSRAGVITAVEDERRRLRHDLHDTVGPTLTGIAYAADAARNTLDADPVRAHALLAALREDTATALDDVRRVVEGLRPPAVDELGLVGALSQRTAGLHAADGRRLTVSLETPTALPQMPAAVEVAAYRIVVEALTNVARHAGARHATVRLACDQLRLTVEVYDDGRSTAPWRVGVGLLSMRERAEQLGGDFCAQSGPAGGRVTAVLPLG